MAIKIPGMPDRALQRSDYIGKREPQKQKNENTGSLLEELKEKMTALQKAVEQAQSQNAAKNQAESAGEKQQADAAQGEFSGGGRSLSAPLPKAEGEEAPPQAGAGASTGSYSPGSSADDQLQAILKQIAGHGKKAAQNDAKPQSLSDMLFNRGEDKNALKTTPELSVQKEGKPAGGGLENVLVKGLQEWVNGKKETDADEESELFLDGFLDKNPAGEDIGGIKGEQEAEKSLSDIFYAIPEARGFDVPKDETFTVSEDNPIFKGYEKWYPPLTGDTASRIWDSKANDGSSWIQYTTEDGEQVYRACEPTKMPDGKEAYKVILPGGGVVYQNPYAKVPKENATQKGSIEIPMYNNSENRDGSAYTAVLDSLNVKDGPRHAKFTDKKAKTHTYCNIFVKDVAKAMGCEIPEKVYLDSAGNPSVEATEKTGSDNWYTSATLIIDWLNGEGQTGEYGWEKYEYEPIGLEDAFVIDKNDMEVQQIIKLANEGKPLIVAWRKEDGDKDSHMAMVAPQEYVPGMKIEDIKIYQAGGINYENEPLGTPFAPEKIEKLQFFYHE